MTPAEALRQLVDAVSRVCDWDEGGRVGAALLAAEEVLDATPPAAPQPAGPSLVFTTSQRIGDARINGRFMAIGRGRAVVSKPYRAFKENFAERVRDESRPPLFGPCIVSMALPWEDTCREPHNNGIPLGDVDSPVKCVLDALKLGRVFVDDSQVVALIASKWPRPEQLIVEVTPCAL